MSTPATRAPASSITIPRTSRLQRPRRKRRRRLRWKRNLLLSHRKPRPQRTKRVRYNHPALKAPDNLPKVVVARKGALRLAAGHPWVYKSDVSKVESGTGPGALVAVVDDRGRFLGSALYSSSSKIAVRLISPEPVNNLPELVREHVRAAIAYRKKLVS